MTVGLLIGTDEFHEFFYRNCPDQLIDENIQFVLPDELYRADVLVTSPEYLSDMPPHKDKPIILLSDYEENIFLDERILAVIPFPTSVDGFTIMADVLLNVNKNLDTYKKFLRHGRL